MKCEYKKHCVHYTNEDLCNEKSEICLVRKKILFRAISSSFQLEEEVEDMIQLNGYNFLTKK